MLQKSSPALLGRSDDSPEHGPQSLFAGRKISQSHLRLIVTGIRSFLLEYIDRDLHCWKIPSVFEPMSGIRYYSLQFTNLGNFLITGLGGQGSVPQRCRQISSLNRSVMVLGCVLVEGDVEAIYKLAKQIRLEADTGKLEG